MAQWIGKPSVASRPHGGTKEETFASTAPSLPLGDIRLLIRKLDLSAEADDFLSDARIRDSEVLTSYNWVDRKGCSPCIIVPGRPPKWTPVKGGPQLSQDAGKYYCDKNAAHFPKHPLEPAVRAALMADPQLPTSVKLFACSSTLGNLLRFVQGEEKSFRMLVEKIGNTVFLVRRENSPTKLIEGIYGFGHTFPEAYTSWDSDVKGSTSNQRLIKYKFSGLDVVLRFEADGYLPSGKTDHASSAVGAKENSCSTYSTGMESLQDTFAQTGIASLPVLGTNKLIMTHGGTLVDQNQIFDIKTRSERTRSKEDHLVAQLPRMWAAQIPNFLLAYHHHGRFYDADIEIKDIREEILKWEEKHNTELAHLAALIHRVVRYVSEAPEGKLELRHPSDEIGTLEVRNQLPDAGDTLSSVVKLKWQSIAYEHEQIDGSENVSRGREQAGERCAENGLDSDNHQRNGVLARSDNVLELDDNVVWTEEESQDFTACSAEDCGYCGECTY